MLNRNLEVLTSYFNDLLESTPHHRDNVVAILAQIEIMKSRPVFSLEPSILLARKLRSCTDNCPGIPCSGTMATLNKG